MRPSTEGPWSLARQLGLLDRALPRLLSQIDRDPDSETYGSCDRAFWMYRLHDFDSGPLQQASLSLAVLAELVREAELDERTPNLLAADADYLGQLSLAVNQRTTRLLARDGLLDEYYPGELSFPGTVFTAHAVLESSLRLGQERVWRHPGLRKTAELLLDREPSAAANQDVAAAAFLARYADALEWKPQRVRSTVQRLLAGPDGKGRLLEYGGGDLGYSTVSLHYLACMLAQGVEEAADRLDELAGFVADFVGPGGQLGGEYASRSTTYWLPLGLLHAARRSPGLAGKLARLDLRSAYDRLDDRYLMHYCLPSLAMAALDVVRAGAPALHLARGGGWVIADHRERGLLAAHAEAASVFVGLCKGGAFDVAWARDQPQLIDAGYRIRRDDLVYASCVLDAEPDVHVDEAGPVLEIRIRCGFRRHRGLTASPGKTVALRLGRGLGPRLNAYFKQRLITETEPLEGPRLTRTLRLDRAEHTLDVEDEVSGLGPGDVLSVAPPVSLRLVPSARFWQSGEQQAQLRVRPSAPRTHRRYRLLGNG